MLITFSVTLKKRQAAIFEFSASALITLREVIIARYDTILDQPERAHFYNHRSNYTTTELDL